MRHHFFLGCSVFRALMLLIACVSAPKAIAIEFVSTSEDKSWGWIEDVPNGCIATKSGSVHNNIYVGFCQNRIPHGRGYFFQDGNLHIVRMNNGREYSRSGEEQSVSEYKNSAYYIHSFNSIFLKKESFTERVPSALDSAVYTSAKKFVDYYSSSAKSQDLIDAKNQLEESKKSTFEYALSNVRNSSASEDVSTFIQKWADDTSPDLHAQLLAIKSQRLTQEKLERERKERYEMEQTRKREAEERERIAFRNKKAPTACNDFYPGYVAKYEGRGWFATADSYVVRYVNKQARMVTIEGTDSGNSLSYGQYLEISCIDLWERTK